MAANYSMNNLIPFHVVALVLAWILDRCRFGVFINQLRLKRSRR